MDRRRHPRPAHQSPADRPDWRRLVTPTTSPKPQTAPAAPPDASSRRLPLTLHRLLHAGSRRVRRPRPALPAGHSALTDLRPVRQPALGRPADRPARHHGRRSDLRHPQRRDRPLRRLHYALSAISTGMLISDGWSWAAAMAVGLAVGVLAGLFNGLAVVLLGVPSFIVTLGTLSVFRGIALLISDGAPISLSSSQPGVAEFSLLGQGRLFGVIPMQFVFFAAVAAIGVVLLAAPASASTPTRSRQPGSRPSRRRQRQAGQTHRVRPLSGFTAGLAGVLGLSFLSYVQGVTGQGLELTVISAVIIGGAALFGGSGTMWGTVIGVAFIGLLQNILNIKGISSFWQTVVTGLVIVAAVAADTWQRKRKTRA
ncbi:ABC transporter permease [Streptomyces rutgersensis]|uniref:ABC transporter permease n=2 Tax=Streptomyces TaxID=1883 RepID=UPI0027E4FDB4|nr:ABC transporter permease [Streptomyces rutgersensis]